MAEIEPHDLDFITNFERKKVQNCLKKSEQNSFQSRAHKSIIFLSETGEPKAKVHWKYLFSVD